MNDETPERFGDRIELPDVDSSSEPKRAKHAAAQVIAGGYLFGRRAKEIGQRISIPVELLPEFVHTPARGYVPDTIGLGTSTTIGGPEPVIDLRTLPVEPQLAIKAKMDNDHTAQYPTPQGPVTIRLISEIRPVRTGSVGEDWHIGVDHDGSIVAGTLADWRDLRDLIDDQVKVIEESNLAKGREQMPNVSMARQHLGGNGGGMTL